MKKTINYLFAALTLIAAASCTEEEAQLYEIYPTEGDARIVELSFEDSGIVKVGVSDRTPQWEVADQIWISNGTSDETITLTAADIKDNKATISTTLEGTLYAVYPASAQNGVSEGKIGFKIPTSTDGTFGKAHIAVAEGTTSLKFKNVVSILKMTAEDATKLVNISSSSNIAGEFKVSYSSLAVEAGTNQAKGVNISSSAAGEKYVAVASGTAFNALEFTAVKAATNWAYKKSSQSTALAINTMYDLGSVAGWSYVTNGPLWAKFSVSAGKKVRFTKGNLYWGGAYHLESAQNVTYATLGQTAYTSSHVCHFFWVNNTDCNTSGLEPYQGDYRLASQGEPYHNRTTGDKFFCGEDDKMTVDSQSDLYALSSGEWEYLFESRTGCSNLYRKGVTVTTGAGTVKNCVVIAPDSYKGTIASSYDAAAWAAAEELGLVCLPAGGYRNGTFLDLSGETGEYSSSTPDASSTTKAYYLDFEDSHLYACTSYSRSRAHSIRLVNTATE